MEHNDFVKLIPSPKLQKKYQKLSKSLVKEKSKEFDEKQSETEEKYKSDIDTHRDHDDLVSICIHPFTRKDSQVQKLGYRFVRADPLYELGCKNMDFLLFKTTGKKPIAIFGEVKTIVTNGQKLMSELDECRQVIEAKLDYIKEHYLKTSTDPLLEYVLAVPSFHSIEAINAISEHDKGIILWLCDKFEPKLKIGQPPPRTDNKQRMLHHDAELMRLLKDSLPSSKRDLAFYPQSHTIRKLKLLLLEAQPTQHGMIINKERLNSRIKVEMSYVDAATQSQELDFIIKEGQTIQFIHPLEDELGDLFRISSRSKALDTLENELEERWISHRVEEAKKEHIRKALDGLQKDILSERDKQTVLFGTHPSAKQSP
ncbi:MAG: hypothetical protein M1503_03780 [Thaumarchaeota archaeon]|nr:hypothetical protein [Nitrososphaerota archaeon]MCL5317374.1 hypothetical protein [Nitrososphaerota archaeon]